MIPNDIRFHYHHNIEYYNQLIKFVTIRNPIDRIISLYTFIMSTKMQARYKKYTSNDFFKMNFYPEIYMRIYFKVDCEHKLEIKISRLYCV